MLGTLDFTGSEYWAPFNFPESTALRILSIHVYSFFSDTAWKVRGIQQPLRNMLQTRS